MPAALSGASRACSAAASLERDSVTPLAPAARRSKHRLEALIAQAALPDAFGTSMFLYGGLCCLMGACACALPPDAALV